jgi:hypothetical protein
MAAGEVPPDEAHFSHAVQAELYTVCRLGVSAARKKRKPTSVARLEDGQPAEREVRCVPPGAADEASGAQRVKRGVQ